MSGAELEVILGNIFSSEQVSPSSPPLPTRFTAFPSQVEQICDLVTLAGKEKITLLPVGGGTRLYGNGHRLDVAVSLSRLKEEFDHSPADLTATVSAGMPFSRVLADLEKHGQTVPLNPPLANTSTVGGIISSNSSGPRRHRYGTARDWVLGTTVVNGTGAVSKAGGKVVKNVSGYDLSKLYIGSRGTLGILLEVTFKLHPVPESRETYVATHGTLDQMFRAVDILAKTPLGIEAMVMVTGDWEPDQPDGWSLVVQLAGPRKTLTAREGRLMSLLGRSEPTMSPLSHADARRLWMNLNRAPDQGGESGVFLMKVSLSKKKLRIFLTKNEVKGEAGISAKLFPGVGVCYLRIPFQEKQPHKAVQRVVNTVRSLEGTVEFEKLSPQSKFDRWPVLPPSLPWMRKIKEALDPDHIFAPGTFVGGI